MSDNDSNLICNNPICELYNTVISKDDAILGSTGELCCPKCGMLLVTQSNDNKKIKALIIAGCIVLIICILVFGGSNIFKSKTNDVSKQLTVTDTTKKEVATTEDHTKEVKEAKPDIAKPKASETDELIANTLEDGLQKIGNKEYPLSNREKLITKELVKFESNNISVKVIKNNNEYEYFTIKKYFNRILIQGINNISVKEEIKNNNGLIKELIVNEK